MCQNLDECLYMPSAGLSKSKTWKMRKEGKILFHFTIILLTVCLVSLQPAKGSVSVAASTFSTSCCFSADTYKVHYNCPKGQDV